MYLVNENIVDISFLSKCLSFYHVINLIKLPFGKTVTLWWYLILFQNIWKVFPSLRVNSLHYFAMGHLPIIILRKVQRKLSILSDMLVCSTATACGILWHQIMPTYLPKSSKISLLILHCKLHTWREFYTHHFQSKY